MKSKKNAPIKQESITDRAPKPVAQVFIWIFLIIWALLNLFPIYFMFTFSLKSNEEIFGANIIGLPREWLWSNYSAAMNTGRMWLYFVNSILVTVASIAISIMAGMMATYAINRIRWKFSKLTNAFFMLGLTIPIQASIVPVYVLLSKASKVPVLNMVIGLNRYTTLIIPYAAFSLSMAILISTGFMVEIPSALDEAARIDGASKWQCFKSITFPMVFHLSVPLVISSFAANFNNFGNIYMITQGGPARVDNQFAGYTDILASTTYKMTTWSNRYELSATFSVLIFLIVGTFTLANMHFSGQFKEVD